MLLHPSMKSTHENGNQRPSDRPSHSLFFTLVNIQLVRSIRIKQHFSFVTANEFDDLAVLDQSLNAADRMQRFSFEQSSLPRWSSQRCRPSSLGFSAYCFAHPRHKHPLRILCDEISKDVTAHLASFLSTPTVAYKRTYSHPRYSSHRFARSTAEAKSKRQWRWILFEWRSTYPGDEPMTIRGVERYIDFIGDFFDCQRFRISFQETFLKQPRFQVDSWTLSRREEQKSQETSLILIKFSSRTDTIWSRCFLIAHQIFN